MTRNANYIRTQEQLRIIDMQSKGATVIECFEWLVNHLRDERRLKGALESVGLSKNACRRLMTGEGNITLITAILLAESVNMKLTLEVDK